MNRLTQPAMTAERQTAQNKITPVANEGDATTPGQSGVAVLDRVSSILFALRPGDYALTLAELTTHTGLYKNTILRLTGPLTQYRMLSHLEDGHYQIDAALLMLGALYQRNMRLGDMVLPRVHALTETTGKVVSLYIRECGVRVCLHRVDSNRSIRDHIREGNVLLLECGSGGRVSYAFLGMQGVTYDMIQRDHYYVSVGERNRETVDLSVLVFDMQQALWGALCPAGPALHINGALLQSWRVPMLEHTAQITSTLGGDPAPLRFAAQLIPKTQAPLRRPTF